MEQEELLILVDEADRETGVLEKMAAHRQGRLHRAFSIFIFNSSGEMLLQQRADAKYHSGGLWTNACCSHPRPGEGTHDGAVRRLGEEMGMYCELKHAFSFIYRANMGNGLTEHELDHVFIGFSNTIPEINQAEVQDFQYCGMDVLEKELKEMPEKFTVWFRKAFPRLKSFVHQAGHSL